MARGLRDRLVGAWKLQEYSATAEDGSVVYPMGGDATGLIIYTPDGYMSAQLMTRGRPPYAAADPQGGTCEEESAAARGYLAYSGPFSVDEKIGIVRHHASVSLFPNWIGSVQERIAQLDGDILTLSSAPMTYEGTRRTPRLVWRRAEPNAV
jgi:hypothetical protein